MANILFRMLNSLSDDRTPAWQPARNPTNSPRAASFREQDALTRCNFRHFARTREPVEAMGVLLSWIRATG
jgi:hypothetical protein